MANAPVNITITGAAGNIGYALLFRIASGALLGPDQRVNLRLLDGLGFADVFVEDVEDGGVLAVGGARSAGGLKALIRSIT